VVKYAQDYLNEYVKKYRLEKTQKEVVFLEKRVEEAQNDTNLPYSAIPLIRIVTEVCF
jgi:hypothetical protein